MATVLVAYQHPPSLGVISLKTMERPPWAPRRQFPGVITTQSGGLDMFAEDDQSAPAFWSAGPHSRTPVLPSSELPAPSKHPCNRVMIRVEGINASVLFECRSSGSVTP